MDKGTELEVLYVKDGTLPDLAAVLVHGPVQVVLHRLLQVTCCNVLRFDGKFGQETEVFQRGFSNAVGTRTDCATTHVREACKLWYTQHFRNDIVL